jgi:hypothetical protein
MGCGLTIDPRRRLRNHVERFEMTEEKVILSTFIIILKYLPCVVRIDQGQKTTT